MTTIVCGQSNFTPAGFKQYCESIQEISFQELTDKYDRKSVYYSSRTYPSDPSHFDYFDTIEAKLGITAAERDLISRNHFMVSERMRYESFESAYKSVYENDLPLFLSTDFFLHTLHASYDLILKDIEVKVLEPNLLALLEGLKSDLENFYDVNNPANDLLQSVKDIDLYLSIAISLLKDETVKPEWDDSGFYDVLMEGIESHSGILHIPLFSVHPRKLDASQFIPRGHYTDQFYTVNGQRDLSAYFKTMIWLGRVDFMLTPPPVGEFEEAWSEADMKRMTIDAVLLNQLLNESEHKDKYDLHEEVTSFLVGPPDNLTPEELTGICNDLHFGVNSLTDDGSFRQFREKLKENNEYGQKILSNFFFVDADKENPAELPVSFRLLGQKFIIDSYVFSQVVYDRIYHDGEEVYRMLPDPLDAMFVLGNEDALELLKDELDSWNYGYKLAELRYLTDAWDASFWDASLYNSWLDAIRQLNPPEEAGRTGFPYFMKTTQWQQEKLNTQLASWTELRHDNVLYAKQSYTGGASCSFPHIYVEPYPGFYQKLADFGRIAGNFFSQNLSQYSMNDYGYELPPLSGISQFFEVYADLMIKLKNISEKELREESLNNEDITFLKQFFNLEMICGQTITGWFSQLFFVGTDEEKSYYQVVDVHTQPTDAAGNVVGNILHAGTGNINLGVFIAGSPSNHFRPMAFVGPVMSFHTKVEPNFNRLTDEKWKDLFTSGLPGYDGRPDWVNGYLTDMNGNNRGSGHELKGAVYDQTDTQPVRTTDNIAYLISWPNPASDHTMLHFFTNNGVQKINVDVFDLKGRHIGNLATGEFMEGEHYCLFNTSGLGDGMYIVRLTCGLQSMILRVVVSR